MNDFTSSRRWLMVVFLVTVTTMALGYSGGSGTSEDPYQIATAEDLISLGNEPQDYDKSFILTADIDLSGYTFDRAVIAPDAEPNEVYNLAFEFQGTPFSGYFDGRGHVIRHLCIQGYEGSDYLGLFGRLDNGAIITNLGLEDVDIINGDRYVSGLVGYNTGYISTSYSTGTIKGNMCVCGLVGYNTGYISSSYSTNTVNGNRCVGGLVGINWYGHILSSYNTGTICGDGSVGGLVGFNFDGSVCLSYSIGTVSGKSNVGGLVGDGWDDLISSSFWDIETSGQTESKGGTGLSTAEMQNINTYLDAGWDFVDETDNGTEDIWFMPEGQYPLLWWQGDQAFSPLGCQVL